MFPKYGICVGISYSTRTLVAGLNSPIEFPVLLGKPHNSAILVNGDEVGG